MATRILDKAVMAANIDYALEENSRNVIHINDSDYGDNVAIELDTYNENLHYFLLPNEILVYDIRNHKTDVIELDNITFEDIDLINYGIYVILKNRKAYDQYIATQNDPYSDIPMCYDENGNRCFPFMYRTADPSNIIGNENDNIADFLTDDRNYFNQIDNKTDTCNTYLIKKFMHKGVPGYIYTLILSLMAINYEINNDNDRRFVTTYTRAILMRKLGLSAEEYDDKYKSMVIKAAYDAENLIYALRFKELPEDATDAFNIHYGDTAFSFFSNIFGNSLFNPYLGLDEPQDFLSVI